MGKSMKQRIRMTVQAWLTPPAKRLARCGISPSAITLMTPLLVSLICLWFVQTRAVWPFCLFVAAVGCFDALDGAVARGSGRVSRFGAYLDAMCDRYVEAIIVLSTAWVSGYWVLSMIVLAGALLTSYAKARAAMEVDVSNLEWPDLLERPERSALFLIGLALNAWLPWKPLGKDLFWWMLLVLALLTHATVVQRMLRARRFINERQSTEQ